MISEKTLKIVCAILSAILVALVCHIMWPYIDRQKTRLHYRSDERKLAAAEFLTDNMDEHFTMVGDGWIRYDTIFNRFEKYFERHGYHGESSPMTLQHIWDSVEVHSGPLKSEDFLRRMDTDQALSDVLIENIDAAFEAWQSVPDSLVTKDFRMFCEYVLPYRIGNEALEPTCRRHLWEEYRGMRDTMFTDIQSIEKAMNKVLREKKGYSNSELMWQFPYSIPVSRMEKMRRGSCMHICEYYVHVLRALGIPATIDEVDVWGNRSGGHCWVTVMKDSTTECALDALTGKNLRLTYRPIKVYRRTYKTNPVDKKAKETMPYDLTNEHRIDVSHKYFKTHTIRIKAIPEEAEKHGYPEYALICAYDNTKRLWTSVDYGKHVGDGVYEFKNIIGGNCAIMAFYDKKKNEHYAASQPFTITESGQVEMTRPIGNNKRDMKLTRKYPRFKRMDFHARKLHRTWVEGADNAGFDRADRLMTIDRIPGDINDTSIICKKKYRYVRWTVDKEHKSCLAEIRFYGKRTADGPEVPLIGRVIGGPKPTIDTRHPYKHAIDGDPATYFDKKANEDGYVGLDLGEGYEAYITRIKFYPRSDTNYIIPRHMYKLYCWDNGWRQIGIRFPMEHELNFTNIPEGMLYLLRDMDGGNEERPFTMDGDKQVWW